MKLHRENAFFQSICRIGYIVIFPFKKTTRKLPGKVTMKISDI